MSFVYGRIWPHAFGVCGAAKTQIPSTTILQNRRGPRRSLWGRLSSLFSMSARRTEGGMKVASAVRLSGVFPFALARNDLDENRFPLSKGQGGRSAGGIGCILHHRRNYVIAGGARRRHARGPAFSHARLPPGWHRRECRQRSGGHRRSADQGLRRSAAIRWHVAGARRRVQHFRPGLVRQPAIRPFVFRLCRAEPRSGRRPKPASNRTRSKTDSKSICLPLRAWRRRWESTRRATVCPSAGYRRANSWQRSPYRV